MADKELKKPFLDGDEKARYNQEPVLAINTTV